MPGVPTLHPTIAAIALFFQWPTGMFRITTFHSLNEFFTLLPALPIKPNWIQWNSLSYKRGNTKNIRLVHKGPQTSWAILNLRWEDKLLLCAKSDQMIMRTVQQNVFLILNSASHICYRSWAHKAFYSCHDTFFGPERCGQKGEGKKVRGWGCWECPSKGREATQAFNFFFCHPTIQEYSPKVHQNVCDMSS